jgi:glycosyltransferase involved in cell wall biosynthesis
MNDGSRDGTHAILQSYSQKDARVKVFTQNNQGVTRTLNTLLAKVDSDYLFILDSDDCLHPQTLEILRTIIERDRVDVVECSICRVDATPLRCEQSLYADHEYANPVVLRDMSIFLSKKTQRGSWINKQNKLYRIEKIRDLHFSEQLAYEEDYFYASQVNTRIEAKALIDLPLYYYRKNPSGVTGNVNFEKYVSSGINRIQLSYDYFIAGGRVPVSYHEDFMSDLAQDAYRMIVQKNLRRCRSFRLRRRLFAQASAAIFKYTGEGVIQSSYLKPAKRLTLWFCKRNWFWPAQLTVYLS